MSEILNIQDNASNVVTKLNQEFLAGSNMEELTIQDTATLFIQKINYNFENFAGDTVFPQNTILTLDIGTLQTGEDIGGMTIEDFVRYGINGKERSLKFLHISDVHNLSNAITRCKTLQDNDSDIAFTILTGDYSAQGGGYSSINTALQNLGNDLLMVNGNHDIYNTFGSNQSQATSFLKSVVTNTNVVWGDTHNVASYWYRDIPINNEQKLRIIGVDSYDYRANVGTGSIYDTIYTQEQVNWFINRIDELNPEDYLIIAMHEPPVNATVYDYQYNVSGRMDNNIVAKRRSNKFCSSRLWVWDTSLTNGNLFPTIINAYLNKLVLDATVTNTNTITGSVLSTLTLLKDFRNSTPCTFLFYIAGHLHGDYVEYHPDFPNQLILLVDNSNTSSLGNSSDLGTRSSDTGNATRSLGIIINNISLDFALKTITIIRDGEHSAGSYNGFSSITRDEIEMPFHKQTVNNE